MRNILYLLLLLPVYLQAQETLSGKVLDEADQPLPGAGIFWLNTSVSATTADDGTFTLPYSHDNKKLIITYMGYEVDTILSLKRWHTCNSFSSLSVSSWCSISCTLGCSSSNVIV